MKTKYFVILVILLAINTQSFSQCCGAGNPVAATTDIIEISPKTLIIIPIFKTSFSNQYYTGNKKAEYSPDKMSFNFISFDFYYGLTWKLSAYGQIGYFIDKTKHYNFAGWDPIKGFGLGDAAIAVKYVLINNITKKFNVSTELGSKIPVGVFDQEVNNVKLPISLQPSSGSFRYNGTLYVNKNYSKIFLSFRGFIEISQRINSKNFDYKYGNLYYLALSTTFRANQKISFGSQFRYEIRQRAKRENEIVIEATGGQVFFVSPQLNYFFNKTTGVSIFADLPVYRYNNGTQISNTFMLGLRAIKTFDFNQ